MKIPVWNIRSVKVDTRDKITTYSKKEGITIAELLDKMAGMLK
jgi:hypothetical protein